MIPIWLQIWKYLDVNKSVSSVSLLMQELKISPVSAYENVIFLEELGIINVLSTTKGKVLTANEKFFSTRSVFKDIYDTYERGDGSKK